MKNKTFLANCALVLKCVIWGMNFIFQKQASQHLGPSPSSPCGTIWAFCPCCPCFSICAGPQGPRRSGGRRGGGERWHGRRFWLASLGSQPCQLGGGAVLVQIGLHVADAHQGRLHRIRLHRTGAGADLLLFRKRPPRRVWIGIAMAIVGLYLLCISDGFSLT